VASAGEYAIQSYRLRNGVNIIMSRLEFYSRPLVAFDAANKDHRRYYAEFVERGGWGQCPLRFIVPDQHGDLLQMIQRSLNAYYIEREFSLKKLPRKKK